MNRIGDFVRSMTVWNWLAVAAFLLALMSALNSFLSLRVRYRDWIGTLNKKNFDSEIKELTSKFVRIEKAKHDTNELILWLFQEATMIFLLLCFTFAVFILGRFFWPFAVISFLLTLGCLVLTREFFRLINRIRYPQVFAMEAIEFIKAGADKGLTSKEADDLIRLVAESKMFQGIEKKVLFSDLTELYPEIAKSFEPK